MRRTPGLMWSLTGVLVAVVLLSLLNVVIGFLPVPGWLCGALGVLGLVALVAWWHPAARSHATGPARPASRTERRPAPLAPYGDAPSPLPEEDVQFTAFRPDRIQPGDWYRLLVFVHTSRDFRDLTGTVVRPLVEVEAEASRLLDPAKDAYGSVRQDGSVALPKGTALTFRPWLDNARFDIDQKIVPWWDPVQRIDFRFMVPRAAAGTHLSGGVDIFRGPLLVADMRFTITVSAEPPKSLWEQDTVVMPAARYRKIFASYSRHDLAVVNSISTVANAFGDTYLLDVNFLRSGERWNDRIYQAISEADIFQLFWSSHSMRSDFVRQEWEHALRLDRPDFIRPVYWEDPLPQDPVGGLPPDALRRIHFARLPVATDPVGRSAPDPESTTVPHRPPRSASSGEPEPRGTTASGAPDSASPVGTAAIGHGGSRRGHRVPRLHRRDRRHGGDPAALDQFDRRGRTGSRGSPRRAAGRGQRRRASRPACRRRSRRWGRRRSR